MSSGLDVNKPSPFKCQPKEIDRMWTSLLEKPRVIKGKALVPVYHEGFQVRYPDFSQIGLETFISFFGTLKDGRLHLKFCLLALLAMLTLVTACAPKVAPTANTTPLTPQTPTTMLTPDTSTPRLEDTAWASLVEAAKKEGKVTVYSFGFTGDLGLAIANGFYKKYGIKADIMTGPASGLAERVRTEHRMKNLVVDVGEFTSALSILLLNEGLLVPLAKELRSLREDVWLLPPTIEDGGYILFHTLTLAGPWVNTDLVKPDQEPKSWVDLLDPRWKGKLLTMDPRTTPSPDRFVHMLSKYKIVESDFFPKLVAQNPIVPIGIGQDPPYVALARGDGAILVFGMDVQAGAVVRAGAHIKPTVPREGVMFTGASIQLIKGTTHPNAGKLFVDYVLSREGQELESKMRLVGSLRKDVPDQSLYASLKPFKIFANNNIQDEVQIGNNFRDGIAAKVLGVR